MGNNKIKVIADKQDLIDIADALREKTGNGKSMGIGAIVSTIRGMADADGMNTADATITSGAEMLEGVTAYGPNGKVTGTIPSQEGSVITPNNQTQTAITGGTYVTGDITVSAVPTETKNITSNGVYQPATGKYFSSVNVNIPGETFETQSKTVSPTEQQQVVSPDSGYNGLSSVTVNAIASDYVGSNVPREDAKTITPTKSSQVAVSGGTYVNGDISVGAIPSEYITTNDADAIAEEIALNKIAYVDGKKVVGSFTIENEVSNQEEIISTQDEMIANIVSALEGKATGGSDTSDATATASDIAEGVTAYVNGIKITGTLPNSLGLTFASFGKESQLGPYEAVGIAENDCIIRQGDWVVINVPESEIPTSDGASIETCTVDFTNDLMGVSDATLKYSMTILDNGVIDMVETENLAKADYATVSNVICGSLCVVTGNTSLNGRVLHVADIDTYVDIFTISITTDYCCFQIPNENKNLFISVGMA